jgi:hypothetical protein
MGFARKRVGKDGKPRYAAIYVDLRGSIRSAGTFTSEKAADRAWQKAEVELRQGHVGDPARAGRRSAGTSRSGDCPTMCWSRPRGRSTPITCVRISFQSLAGCG